MAARCWLRTGLHQDGRLRAVKALNALPCVAVISVHVKVVRAADIGVASRLRLSASWVDASVHVVFAVVRCRSERDSLVQPVGWKCVLGDLAVSGNAPDVEPVSLRPVSGNSR